MHDYENEEIDQGEHLRQQRSHLSSRSRDDQGGLACFLCDLDSPAAHDSTGKGFFHRFFFVVAKRSETAKTPKSSAKGTFVSEVPREWEMMGTRFADWKAVATNKTHGHSPLENQMLLNMILIQIPPEETASTAWRSCYRPTYARPPKRSSEWPFKST